MRAASSLVVAALAWIASAGVARADDTTDLQSLLNEHVVTTASTTAQRASVAPALSTTITAEDLQTYGIRTLAEAINFLSLGVITADPLRTPDIGSRGVLFENDDGKHFLLLVNGHAMNDPLYGAAYFDEGAGVPIDIVDHIEVIVGPGSVLYGSNAMMGVVNVITKGASDDKGVHLGAEYEPGRSVRASAGTGFTFKLFGAPSEVTFAAQYDQRFGPRLAFPEQNFGGGGPGLSLSFGRTEPGPGIWGGNLTKAYFTQAPAGMLRFRSGDLEINLLASAYRRGVPYTTAAQSVEFDDGDSYQLDRSVRLDVRHQATLSALVQLTSRLYADASDHRSRIDVPGSVVLRDVPRVEYYDAGVARWVGIEERLSLNWLHDQSLVTLLGVDARMQWASAKEDILDADSGAYIGPTAGHLDTQASRIAPYVQQTYSPTSWLDFNAGARLDADSRYSPVLSPRAAVAVRPWEKSTLKADYSQAFRAPTWWETSLANYQVAPSDDLKPETVRSLEGSLEQRFGTQRIVFGVFRSWWSNLIESTTLPADERTMLQNEGRLPPVVTNLAQFRNLAGVDNYGCNGGWEGTLVSNHLRYGVNVTGAYTRLDQGGGPQLLAAAPQFFGNARVAYAFDGYLPTPAFAVSFLGPRPADRASPTGATLPDAPPMADLRLTLSGRAPLVRGLTYRATAEYITASHGPYSAGPTPLFGPGSASPPTVFAPSDQLRFFVGLRYDFLTGSQASTQ
jgi:outer membrane receptor protein involved in Fe transport